MKSIRTASDLAIAGAPPAFEEVLHVGRPNIADKERFIQLANEVLDHRWLTNNGPMVTELERRIQDYLGVEHCVAMCNGTIALEIASRAIGLSGEVIVPSFTFIATAHALSWQEITPVFADIDPHTHSLDPAAAERMITPKTRGIIGVHLWGRPCDIDGLSRVAEEHGLELMFDAAHAFGCTHKGQMIGGFGRCEVFSFHATKFFNTFEGGAVVTNCAELADKMRLMRNFGFAGLDDVIYPGTNGKMTEISAAMGLANLGSLDRIVETNRQHFRAYQDRLSAIPGLSSLPVNDQELSNYQYVVIEVEHEYPLSRDELVAVLHAENVRARRYFWPGCHRMKPYKDAYPHAGLLLQNTERVAERVIILPTGTELPEGAPDTIADILRVAGQR